MKLKNKEYSLEEAIAIYMGRAKELTKEAIEKSEKMSPEEAAKKIKGQHKVNEVLPKVASEDRKEVFKELREKNMDKALAKRPLELKKFMEKCMAKKMAKKEVK